MEPNLPIIVIGASAGGVDAIRTIVAALPRGLNAAVFVTLHIGAHRSDLPWLLSLAGPLAAKHPAHGDEIEAGHIYVAPPDHHMLVENGGIGLTKRPRENWARPAIDPLFRSAALTSGPRVIGVILSGGLNDGTAGMIEIKARGGIVIAQDPLDAFTPDMPASVIANVDVDHVVPVSEIGALLAAQFVTMERSLEMAMRSLGERAELCRQMFDKLPDGLAHDEERSRWGAARREAVDRTEPLRRLLIEPWMHPSNSLLEKRRES